MSGISYYNSERYPDPTAYAGLTAAMKAENAKRGTGKIPVPHIPRGADERPVSEVHAVKISEAKNRFARHPSRRTFCFLSL